MTYLKRKADYYLQEWKNNSDRYPLIIKQDMQEKPRQLEDLQRVITKI